MDVLENCKISPSSEPMYLNEGSVYFWAVLYSELPHVLCVSITILKEQNLAEEVSKDIIKVGITFASFKLWDTLATCAIFQTETRQVTLCRVRNFGKERLLRVRSYEWKHFTVCSSPHILVFLSYAPSYLLGRNLKLILKLFYLTKLFK